MHLGELGGVRALDYNEALAMKVNRSFKKSEVRTAKYYINISLSWTIGEGQLEYIQSKSQNQKKKE